MFVMPTRGVATRSGIYVIAIVLGVGAALFMAADIPAGSALAANHCTHYTPTYSQDTQYWCSEVTNIDYGFYNTTGVALRDDNIAAMNSDQLVCTSYDPASYWRCNNVSNSEATEGSSGGYAYANCLIGDGGYGVCKTDWHNA
jgi:hypothetical protein